jgi:hypothetical protein
MELWGWSGPRKTKEALCSPPKEKSVHVCAKASRLLGIFELELELEVNINQFSREIEIRASAPSAGKGLRTLFFLSENSPRVLLLPRCLSVFLGVDKLLSQIMIKAGWASCLGIEKHY